MAAVLVAMAGGVSAVAGGGPKTAVDQAVALTLDPAIVFPANGASLSGTDLQARADERSVRVPLPQGGTFNGIRWGDLATAADEEIDFVLQVNAACQWLRAVADGRAPGDATDVWKAILDWPAMRQGDVGQTFRSALEAIAAGSTGTAPPVLVACRESHDREVGFAESHGLAPPA